MSTLCAAFAALNWLLIQWRVRSVRENRSAHGTVLPRPPNRGSSCANWRTLHEFPIKHGICDMPLFQPHLMGANHECPCRARVP
jgi:hypothetical protein